MIKGLGLLTFTGLIFCLGLGLNMHAQQAVRPADAPVFHSTGNAAADQTTYQKQKEEWVKTHPDVGRKGDSTHRKGAVQTLSINPSENKAVDRVSIPSPASTMIAGRSVEVMSQDEFDSQSQERKNYILLHPNDFKVIPTPVTSPSPTEEQTLKEEVRIFEIPEAEFYAQPQERIDVMLAHPEKYKVIKATPINK